MIGKGFKNTYYTTVINLFTIGYERIQSIYIGWAICIVGTKLALSTSDPL